MTNYYVTYTFKNKDTRNAFYEEVKASEAIIFTCE